ncbi:MAG: beta-ketoacyl synthase chain length factor [Methylococcaceae bacterium]|nr:beta-ketoacyl synthase chain length factor [Methylococcaceae bacterium]
MNDVFIKSVAVCCPVQKILDQFALQGGDVDKTLIPAGMRRRTSLTTKIAITAAKQACNEAEVDTGKLPSVFASLGGEIQVTDALCRMLPDADELLSPTQFHNSVHNTTAGYWGILTHCQAATSAIAAVDDTFAMGLLEAWSQLQQTAGDILLVCYDEQWPQYLAPPIGQVAFACAFVLSTDSGGTSIRCTIPRVEPQYQNKDKTVWERLVKQAPAAAAIPLIQTFYNKKQMNLIPLNISGGIWCTHIDTDY